MAQAKKLVPADDLPDSLVPADDLPDGAVPSSDIAQPDISMVRQADNRLAPTVGKNLLDPPGSIEEALSRVKEVGSTAMGTAAKSALPLIGGILGTAGGAMAAPFTGPAAPAMPIMGEMAGSAGGEYLNQLIGITEKDSAQIALAGGAPLVGRALSSIARGVPAAFLRAFGGRQNVADAAGEILKKKLAPPTPAEELYDIAGTINAYVPTPKTVQRVQDILKGEVDIPSSVSKQIKDAITGYQGTFQHGNFTTAIPGQDIAKIIKDLRFEGSAAYKAGNTRLGHAINSMRGALLDDTLDAGIPEFAAAGNAARREIAIDKLAGVLHSPNPVTALEKAMTSKSDRFFKGTFSDSEIESIKRVVNKMSTVTPSGFSGVVGRTLGAAVGAGAASNPVGQVAAGMTGWFAPDIAAKLLTTQWGRKAIEQNLLGKPLDNTTMARIATVVRGDYADSGPIKDAITDLMKSKKISIKDKINAAMVGSKGGVAAGEEQR